MTDDDNFERLKMKNGTPPNPEQIADYKVGYGRPPKEHQVKKGQPALNPKGRPKGSRKRKIDLYAILMEDVWATINGQKIKLPFTVAHIQLIKERASKGDAKADQTLIQFYKAIGLFDNTSADPNEDYKFTVNIGRPLKTLLGEKVDDPLLSRQSVRGMRKRRTNLDSETKYHGAHGSALQCAFRNTCGMRRGPSECLSGPRAPAAKHHMRPR
jgi:hypothetical protein